MKVKVTHNSGIISTGNDAENTIIQTGQGHVDDINWERLIKEVELLKTNSDSAIREFASDASQAIAEKEPSKVKTWLTKWIPCIGKFIQTSYYILEISAKLGVL